MPCASLYTKFLIFFCIACSFSVYKFAHQQKYYVILFKTMAFIVTITKFYYNKIFIDGNDYMSI